MQIDILTIFPKMFPEILGASLIGRAQKLGILRIEIHDLRDYTHDKRRTVDDRPYGGGPGMVMKPQPIYEAVGNIRKDTCCGHDENTRQSCQALLMSPSGEVLSNSIAQQMAQLSHMIVICGHYEGIDERIRGLLVDRTISIGDYVLTGGELPAMVLVDCVARFIPGVIGHKDATQEESFSQGLLEYPQYTRPPVFQGLAVPSVLQSGDHEAIAKWRKLKALERTFAVRPDLLRS